MLLPDPDSPTKATFCLNFLDSPQKQAYGLVNKSQRLFYANFKSLVGVWVCVSLCVCVCSLPSRFGSWAWAAFHPTGFCSYGTQKVDPHKVGLLNKVVPNAFSLEVDHVY